MSPAAAFVASSPARLRLSVLDDRDAGNTLGHVVTVAAPRVGMHVFRTLLPLWDGKEPWTMANFRVPLCVVFMHLLRHIL